MTNRLSEGELDRLPRLGFVLSRHPRFTGQLQDIYRTD